MPERPFSPNRPAIVLIGLVASLGSGLGLAWLRDAFDPSVKGPLELARIAPPASDRHPLHRDAVGTDGAATAKLAVFILVALLAIAFLVGRALLPEAAVRLLDAVARQMIFW